MRTVYAVESGEYSDAMVHALFETQDLADEYRNLIAEAGARYWSDYPGGDYSAELTSQLEKYEVVRYQLWDSVPVVETDDYRPDHTGAEPVG